MFSIVTTFESISRTVLGRETQDLIAVTGILNPEKAFELTFTTCPDHPSGLSLIMICLFKAPCSSSALLLSSSVTSCCNIARQAAL